MLIRIILLKKEKLPTNFVIYKLSNKHFFINLEQQWYFWFIFKKSEIVLVLSSNKENKYKEWNNEV